MASVGFSNCWFCSSSVLTTNPLPNKRLNSACNFILPISRNTLKEGKVYCKQLPDTQPSGTEQNPTNREATISRSKMEEYNIAMKRMMRSPYEYHHDLGQLCSIPTSSEYLRFHWHSGMNYTLITDNLIVGSQPQMPEDVDHLKQEQNVAYILNLQQDKDIEYWGIDLQSIIIRCQELGIRHMRRPARDFDPDSLRSGLPKAVSSLEWAISKGKGKVYVHCTAGLGRAPAVAISYMFWFCGMNLNSAYDMLTAKRPCGPNRRAIKGATYDLAKNDPWKEPFESLPEYAFEDIADWERNLIQDRVRALRGS